VHRADHQRQQQSSTKPSASILLRNHQLHETILPLPTEPLKEPRNNHNRASLLPTLSHEIQYKNEHTSTGLTTFTLKHDPLTPIEGKPTQEAIRKLRQELYANVRGITTDLGDGQHGHLGLLMPDADYLALPGAAAYILPLTRPDLPPYNGTAGAREELAARYKLQQAEYNDAHGLKEQLMKLLIVAIPSLYLTTREDDNLGLALVTPKQILAHLITDYAAIKADDLEANLTTMKAPWDPSTDLELVFARALKCRRFAASGGDPISDPAYIHILLEVFTESGVFTRALEDWRAKDDTDHTTANLKTHFGKADKECLCSTSTLKATLSAHAAIANSSKPGHPFPSPGGTDLSGWKYCWSHGLSLGGHSSSQCTRPYKGHCKEATLSNRMGGVTRISAKKGDKPAFVPPPSKQKKKE
jgi:hypothetical protein